MNADTALGEFHDSLSRTEPPALGPALRALWWDAKGEWDRAHTAAQEGGGSDGAWVHAYLHRKEGDLANARYWYSRAGRPMPSLSLDEEWTDIVRELFARP